MDRKAAIKKFAKLEETVIYVPKEGEQKCSKCSLYGKDTGTCLVKGLFTEGDCLAGDGKIFNRVKLYGSREQFIKSIRDSDEHNLAGRVWEWTLKALEEGRGCYYVRESVRLMREYKLKKNIEEPLKEDIQKNIYCLGPDNFQLEVPREWNPEVQKIWWLLIMDQFNLRARLIPKKKNGNRDSK